jgi:hypothetical protein
VRRTGARRPLVVGDRLDTDIEGARRAGAASLLVFTGVTDPTSLLAAGPEHRPDLIAPDCAGLLVPHPAVRTDGSAWWCGSWVVRPDGDGDGLLLGATEGAADAGTDGLDGLRALCVAHWERHAESGAEAVVAAADERAAGLLAGWALPGAGR